jgi:hypothetical protein
VALNGRKLLAVVRVLATMHCVYQLLYLLHDTYPVLRMCMHSNA